MLRHAARSVLAALVTLTLFFGFALIAEAPAAAVSQPDSPAVVMVANTDNAPVGDCVALASGVLFALAIRTGSPAVASGAGSNYANASQALGLIGTVISTMNCTTYLAEGYADLICEQSHQALRYKKTWEARSIVAIATHGRRTTCS